MKRAYETTEYFAMLRRMVVGGKKHEGQGGAVARCSDDIDGLSELIALRDLIEQATADSIANLREDGYSWADVAARIGCSRQAAQQRYGKKAAKKSSRRK